MTEQPAAIVITGGKIEGARWLAVRSALGLEIKGFTRNGTSARILANRITGQNHARRNAAYTALNAHIVTHLGQQFDRPLTKAR